MVNIFANNPQAMYNPVAPTKAQYQKTGNDMVDALSEITGLNFSSSKVSPQQNKISSKVLTQAKSYQTKTGAGHPADLKRLNDLKAKLTINGSPVKWKANKGVLISNDQWQRQLKAKAVFDKERAQEVFQKRRREKYRENLKNHPFLMSNIFGTLFKILKFCGFTAFGETLKWHTLEFQDYLKQVVMMGLLYAAFRLETKTHFIMTLIPYLALTGLGTYMGAMTMPTI